MTQHEPRELVTRGAEAVYERTGRRGFLAKTSGFLAALGLGTYASAESASADPRCCVGPACRDIGVRCNCDAPDIEACPDGWHWTGYTWGCCVGEDRLFLCKDCVPNGGGGLCVCGCRTRLRCNLTVTELMSQRA